MDRSELHAIAAPKLGSTTFTPLRVRTLASGEFHWAFSGELIGVQVFTGESPETYPIEVSFPDRSLVYSRAGTWVLGGFLLPPGHVALMPKGVADGVVAAGRLHLMVFNWRGEAMPWLDGVVRQVLGTAYRVRPGEVLEIPDEPTAAAELGLIGELLSTVSGLLSHPCRICLRPCPEDAGVFTSLIAAVDAEPNRTWTLHEAADEAGYSPFHFSRTFKQQIGCGFHEYVDRLRTETAVMSLLGGSSLSEAVRVAGFTSARSLRESLRDYLGLLPGDLRLLD